MTAFDTHLDAPFDGAFVQDRALAWIARNNAKPQRPAPECWVLHASPQWSAAHLDDDPVAVCATLLAELHEIAGRGPRRPSYLSAHRWRYALPLAPLTGECLGDSDARVALCGDWCQGGRVEGAFLSGRAAARRIIADLRPASRAS